MRRVMIPLLEMSLSQPLRASSHEQEPRAAAGGHALALPCL